MGCYLAPDETSTIERVIKVLKECAKGAELLVAGDMNTNLAAPVGNRKGEDIASALTTEGLEDILSHFPSRRHPW